MSKDPRHPPHVCKFTIIDPVNKIARCICGKTYIGK